MEKKVVFWIIGIVVVAAVLFNMDSLTSNVAKSGKAVTKEPYLSVLTPTVQAGSDIVVKIRNIKSLSSSRLQIFSSDESYSGTSFPIPGGDCKSVSAGYYDCESSFNIPGSLLPNGRYYIQVKNDASGSVVGNQALFNIENSEYQETGR